ncbi:hypothetical protein DUI87_00781 [Hirundo rustica rustica]|uniref:RNase H type-1 domain-containing protein n=1 Tax=Hirundo rustica rustica TaxID=333673 RepID=A0A3M0LTZ2_HIRRU|nr:hypothetical protein DUI87_00781 [Hirundo rustica rustica]
MVANALWGRLKRWKEDNWQCGGKPIWAAEEWKDIATRVERLLVKVHHIDAHIPKNRATEEHRNNEQVDRAVKIEVSKIDLDWEHKGELFLARWAHDASGHQGRDATYKWAQDRGVDLTMDSISQVIHDCETCAAIKQAKWVKPLWYSGRWSKYKYEEAWQIDYITLPQTYHGRHETSCCPGASRPEGIVTRKAAGLYPLPKPTVIWQIQTLTTHAKEMSELVPPCLRPGLSPRESSKALAGAEWCIGGSWKKFSMPVSEAVGYASLVAVGKKPLA